MSAARDILDWSEEQDRWKREALRLLFVEKQLTPDDYSRLYTMFLSQHNLGPELTDFLPLTEAHLLQEGGQHQTVLCSIEDMTAVNRYPNGSQISFASTGLTAVFGENGAGKSGLSRLIKQVCRARVRTPVLPNVYAENYQSAKPSATFRYQDNGEAYLFEWTPGAKGPEELAAIAVLDEACADHYVGSEGEVAYQPYGLAQLEALANQVIPQLQGLLRQEIDLHLVDLAPHRLIAPHDTQVGAILRTLNAGTSIDELRNLAMMTAGDERRRVELVSAIASTDPEPLARESELYAARVERVLHRARSAQLLVTDAAVAKWSSLLSMAQRRAHEREQALAVLETGSLSGTGDGPWRTMLDAAREFSVRQAYPEHDFPFIGEGALCPLCQQELDAAAKSRLKKFNDFVMQDVITAARQAEADLAEARVKIEAYDASVVIDGVDEAEMSTRDPDLLVLLRQSANLTEERRQWMLSGANPDDEPKVISEPGNLGVVHARVVQLRTFAETLRASSDPEKKLALEKELKELDAKLALVPHLDKVVAAVESNSRASSLQACNRHLATTAVSKLASQLAGKYITDALIEAMGRELELLGAKRLAHTLKRKGDRGKTLVSLALDGTSARAGDVLSEGERRVVAIAFFLAELAQQDGRSAVVVDDPVSSLDHRYRYAVAKRLAAEANSRQVIVLTHDAAFLVALLQEADAPAVRALEWKDNSPGYVSETLPWMQKSVGDRISSLQADRKRLEENWGDEPSEATRRDMAAVYARVRGTVERLIREEILNKAVKPFEDRVHVERVAAIAGFSQEEWVALNGVYLRCNPALDGHDSNAEGARDVPNPAVLAADISILNDLKTRAQARRKAVKSPFPVE